MLIRGIGYHPDPDKSIGFVMELAGSQAQIVYDFKRQTFIHSRKLAKVPTFKVDSATLLFATTGQAIRANLFLNCIEDDLGIMICSKTDRTFDKQFLLSCYLNKKMRVDRFLPHGTEIHKPVLPQVDDTPVGIEINIIEFTREDELVYEQVMSRLSTPELSRSNQDDVLPTDYEVYRPPFMAAPNIPILSDNEVYRPPFMALPDIQPNTSDRTIDISDEEIVEHNTEDSSFQAGLIVSGQTGRVQLITHQSDPRPIPMLSFTPNATSTEDEPRGPTAKGKSRDGRGKSSSNVQREPLRQVNLPPNLSVDTPNLANSPVTVNVQVGQADITDNSPGRDLVGITPIRSTSKENVRTPPTRKRKRTVGKSPTGSVPKRRPKKKKNVIMTGIQANTIRKYLNQGQTPRLIWIKRSCRRRVPRPESTPPPGASLSPSPQPTQGASPTLSPGTNVELELPAIAPPSPRPDSASPERVSPNSASTSKQTPPSKPSSNTTPTTPANSTISPIIPPTNVTIPLQDSSNPSTATSTSAQPSMPATLMLNSRLNDDPQSAESSSVIFIENAPIVNMNRGQNITSPDIRYDTPLQGAHMPLYPNPAWPRDPSRVPTVELPEHVVLVADPSTNVVEQRFWINVRSDPWQVIQAVAFQNLTSINDEGFENSDTIDDGNIVIYNDPVLAPPNLPDPVPAVVPFPDPVPAVSRSAHSDQAAVNNNPNLPTSSNPSRPPLRQLNPPLPILDNSRLFSTSNPSTGSIIFPTPDSSQPSSMSTTSSSSNPSSSANHSSNTSGSSLSVNVYESESSMSLDFTTDSSPLWTDSASSTTMAEKQEDEEGE